MYDTHYEENKPSNSKKRVRASQACVHCRKKKIKCDESRPNCTQCQDANVSCEYTEPKKRGPRKGYVQLLEERLAQMERRLMGPLHIDSVQNMTSDEDMNSVSSSHKTRSPVQSYDNPELSSDLPPLEIVNHLIDLFFKYVNSVFPFVHRGVLKKSVQDGSVSRPLLYGVLAISARFSDHPAIRTNPPYLAGERFAEKALSYVNADLLQPSLENTQFWGIMSCLEYGRASGSKSWIYGGLAIRFCQELGYHKEDTMSVPILAEDGSIDTIAMAVRRRVFWSCLSIDKLSSAGTHRPQCIEKSDCDSNPPNIGECLVLRDLTYHKNINGKAIADDSLMNVAKHYMRCVENYGEVNRYMNRAKSNSVSIVWPPIAEHRNLDRQLRAWKDNLPDLFQFNQKNLDYHREFASGNYLSIWLASHAIWCSSMMILHRGSLAFSDIKSSDTLADDIYRRIQNSIDTCRMCVEAAMGIFESIKDLCGYNTLPYMGYSAYVFATVLMTSTFSGTPESCKKSSRGLKILYDLIDGLRPYWPMCERLANATKELLIVHQKLYDTNTSYDNSYAYNTKQSHDIKLAYPSNSPINSRSPSTHSSPSTTTTSPTIQMTNHHRVEPPLSTLLGTGSSTATESSLMPAYAQQPQQDPYKSKPNYYMPTSQRIPTADNPTQQSLDPSSALVTNWNRGNEIDFNSLEFLYDTGLFGQVVFDVNTNQSTPISSYPHHQPLYQSMLQSQPQPSPQSYLPTITTSLPIHHSQDTSSPAVSSATPTTANTPSAFQSMIPQQQQQAATTSASSTPTAYNPSKSLWN